VFLFPYGFTAKQKGIHWELRASTQPYVSTGKDISLRTIDYVLHMRWVLMCYKWCSFHRVQIWKSQK
jgi:hypothetical protein